MINTLLIYVVEKTNRIEYILPILFKSIGINQLEITNSTEQFRTYSGAKINYSNDRISAGEYCIKPVSLLFEKDIAEQPIHCFDWNGIKAFYKTELCDFPFDVFAASFYLLTRYEEYLPHKKDMYGRYAHENSIAFKEGFLSLPLVNIWMKKLGVELIKKFPSLVFQLPTFHFLPTYDIDIAWSYLHKGIIRNLGGFVRSLFQGKWQEIKERVSVLLNRKIDPFDSYQWLHQLHESYHLAPIYFFLLAQKNKYYDKNILPSSSSMQQLIKEHSTKYTVGIHPSWQSGDDNKALKKEIENLQSISGKKITQSRQHYIRMNLPETYRQLIGLGIAEDYSMGYGSINGFRASFCMPYAWYDLQHEMCTKLIVYPFCFMDANSFFEQKNTPKQAQDEMNHYYEEVKNVGGWLITIWHNHFLGNESTFKEWKKTYEQWVKNKTE